MITIERNDMETFVNICDGVTVVGSSNGHHFAQIRKMAKSEGAELTESKDEDGKVYYVEFTTKRKGYFRNSSSGFLVGSKGRTNSDGSSLRK